MNLNIIEKMRKKKHYIKHLELNLANALEKENKAKIVADKLLKSKQEYIEINNNLIKVNEKVMKNFSLLEDYTKELEIKSKKMKMEYRHALGILLHHYKLDPDSKIFYTIKFQKLNDEFTKGKEK